MADPALVLAKTMDTAKREWIGGLDGLLLGFQRMRGSTTEQISVATVQLIEFVLTQRRTGLQALTNRMKDIQDFPENYAMEEEEWSMWAPDKTISTFLRHTIQGWRAAIKAHLTKGQNLSKFVWPSPQKMAADVNPPHLVPKHNSMDELLEFAQAFLQYTPVNSWYTVESNNASYKDKQFANSIIKAFWRCRIQYPAWLAAKDVWAAREAFETILVQASDIDFSFLDGITEMEEANQYAEPVQEDADEAQDGYFGSTNKHILGAELLTLRSKQQKLVKNYIDSMAEQGGIICQDHKLRIPEKVHKKFKAFIMVR
jgi:hypothetical protein